MRSKSGLRWHSRKSFHTGEFMVAVFLWECLILGEQSEDACHKRVDLLSICSTLLALEVAAKRRGRLNLPHSNLPSDRKRREKNGDGLFALPSWLLWSRYLGP